MSSELIHLNAPLTGLNRVQRRLENYRTLSVSKSICVSVGRRVVTLKYWSPTDLSNSVLGHYVVFIEVTSPPVTGVRRVFDDVADTSRQMGYLAPVLHQVASAQELLDVLAKLRRDVETSGEYPILQIDAHGDASGGIAIGHKNSDGTFDTLAPATLVEALGELNQTMKNQLLVCFGVCFAFLINGQVNMKAPAPYSLAFAPVEEVFEQDLLDRLPTFYRHVLECNVDQAFDIVGSVLESFSSEVFLKRALVDMATTTIGRQGRERVDRLLTQVVEILGPEAIVMGEARRFIKRRLRITDEGLEALTRTYLCGRAMPYSANEILSEARKNNSAR